MLAQTPSSACKLQAISQNHFLAPSRPDHRKPASGTASRSCPRTDRQHMEGSRDPDDSQQARSSASAQAGASTDRKCFWFRLHLSKFIMPLALRSMPSFAPSASRDSFRWNVRPAMAEELRVSQSQALQ